LSPKAHFDFESCFCKNAIMTSALIEVTKNAMQLPRHQRLALASFLLEVDGSSNDPTLDEMWNMEIQERIQAIDSGDVAGIPYQEVMRKAEEHLAP
jgi:hypothetical protein